VQNAGSLPLVAKPLFGVLSDAVYIGHQHRLPYVSAGGNSSAPPLPPPVFCFPHSDSPIRNLCSSSFICEILPKQM
jgi:hypothetical protein